MVKIFENNRNLVVIIFYIIFWCEADADANSTTNTANTSSYLYEHAGISHATINGTEMRALQSNESNSFRDERAREIAASGKLHYGDVRKKIDISSDESTMNRAITADLDKYKYSDVTTANIKHLNTNTKSRHKKDATTIQYTLGFGNEVVQSVSKHHFKRQRKHKENNNGDRTQNHTSVTVSPEEEINKRLKNSNNTGILKDPETDESKNKHKAQKHNLNSKEHNYKVGGDHVKRKLEPIQDKNEEMDGIPKRFQLWLQPSQHDLNTPKFTSPVVPLKELNVPKHHSNRVREQRERIKDSNIEKQDLNTVRKETENAEKMNKSEPVVKQDHKKELNALRSAPSGGLRNEDRTPKHKKNRMHEKEMFDDNQGNRPSNSREKHKDGQRHKNNKQNPKTKSSHKKNNKHSMHEYKEMAYSSSTHHAGRDQKHEKNHDIRTGHGSVTERDGNGNNYNKPTKKFKLRMKEKHKNILRSTRMPEAYELQEEKQYEEHHKEKKTKINASPTEDLSPYAIEGQMKRFANKYSKKNIANISVLSVGRTVEYNNIVLLKVTTIDEDSDSYLRAIDTKYTDEKPEKKVIFIVHGLTVAGMRHLIHSEELLENLMKFYIAHLDKFDLFIMPMANPDGYAATFNSQAYGYWNKNMSPQTGCPGVVLDRNFDVAWNHSQKISSCSHGYPGAVPFSEVETRAIRDVFHKYSHKIIAYIHVHASTYDAKIFKGDAVLYPRGYTDTQTDDDRYIDLKGEVEEVMKNASFQVLSVNVDTLHSWYGKVTGTSVDYAASVYGIPFAMEFAMQLYEHIQKDALTEIWGRIINVVFKNIWKNINANPNDVKKK